MDKNGKDLPPEKKHMLLFMMLVKQNEEIAKINLGEIPNPTTNLLEVDLKSARFAIDTLEMMQAYTKGNISDQATDYLSDIISRLNTTYRNIENEG